jgi:hypothetical protein
MACEVVRRQVSHFVRDSQSSIAGVGLATTVTTTMRKITLEDLLAMTIPQRSASSLRLKTTQIRTPASWTFCTEMDAMDDRRVGLCLYTRYLDLRSSPLRREDVRLVRHIFKQRIGLCSATPLLSKSTIYLPCLSSVYNIVSCHHSVMTRRTNLSAYRAS